MGLGAEGIGSALNRKPYTFSLRLRDLWGLWLGICEAKVVMPVVVPASSLNSNPKISYSLNSLRVEIQGVFRGLFLRVTDNGSDNLSL